MNSAAVTRLAAGLLCLSQIGMVHAADKSRASELRSINIRVEAGGFGGASAADITAVLQSAAGELSRYWPRTQLPSIDVYHRADHPQTDSIRAAGNRIAIGLTARDNHWAQYSFQFAHEFCHALANYSNSSRPLVRYPPPCQSLAGRESVRNSFVVYFASDGPLLADRSSVSGLAGIRCMAQLLCGGEARTCRNITFRLGRHFSVWFRQNQSLLRQQPHRAFSQYDHRDPTSADF